MKTRMLALLLVFGLLCGTVCGCDYVEDSSNTSSSESTSIDDIDTITIATTAKETTTAKRTTTTRAVTTTTRKTTEKPIEAMVWIPASGSKYHRNSSCSNMKNPSQVTKSRAIEMGYTPCKKCY